MGGARSFCRRERGLGLNLGEEAGEDGGSLIIAFTGVVVGGEEGVDTGAVMGALDLFGLS